MTEWLKVIVLKTVLSFGSVSSNLTLSLFCLSLFDVLIRIFLVVRFVLVLIFLKN